MIALDSWIWLEFFLAGAKQERAQEILERVREYGAVVSTVALAEVRYRLARQFGLPRADEFIYLMEQYPNLKILPLVRPAALLAAQIRLKHYSKRRPLSYADAAHIATAVLAGCDTLYSGDPDFKDLDEIRTVVI
jgi:predicted nucleic acid-binding protein